eukprot:469171_1
MNNVKMQLNPLAVAAGATGVPPPPTSSTFSQLVTRYKHAEYVLFWYIRTYLESLTQNDKNEVAFPVDIKLLCSTYIGVLLDDEWDKISDHTSRFTIFGDNDRWIKRIPDVYENNTSICGKMLVDYSYIWRLKIGKCDEEIFAGFIGVVPNKNVVDPNDSNKFLAMKSSFVLHPYYGYSYWPHATQRRHGHLRVKYGALRDDVKPETIIEIHLNMEELTISFVVNGKNCGVAFRNIVNTQYRLIVVLHNDDHVMLLNN